MGLVPRMFCRIYLALLAFRLWEEVIEYCSLGKRVYLIFSGYSKASTLELVTTGNILNLDYLYNVQAHDILVRSTRQCQ